LAPLLSKYPTDPKVLAMRATLNAHLGIQSFVEAEAVVRDLIAQNPDMFRLRVNAAYLEARDGGRERAIEELREVVAEYPGEAYAHQGLAGLLHLDKARWTEAWQEYKVALASGPLSSPCFKTAAFQVATTVDPANADEALKGSPAIERLGVRTRTKGFRVMFAIFAMLYVAAVFLLGQSNHVAGIVVACLALVWTAWGVYINDFACCKKCRNAWIGFGLVEIASFIFVYANSEASHVTKTLLLIEICFFVIVIGASGGRTRVSDSPQPPGKVTV
jgi:tetratricopeptide (TPR) repeat protein